MSGSRQGQPEDPPEDGPTLSAPHPGAEIPPVGGSGAAPDPLAGEEDDDEDDGEDEDGEEPSEAERLNYSAKDVWSAVRAVGRFIAPHLAGQRRAAGLLLAGVLVETSFNVVFPLWSCSASSASSCRRRPSPTNMSMRP
jgi:hypothetical protein